MCSHDQLIEKGRHINISRDDRTCKYCTNTVHCVYCTNTVHIMYIVYGWFLNNKLDYSIWNIWCFKISDGTSNYNINVSIPA